jgi:hypothetical protein
MMNTGFWFPEPEETFPGYPFQPIILDPADPRLPHRGLKVWCGSR